MPASKHARIQALPPIPRLGRWPTGSRIGSVSGRGGSGEIFIFGACNFWLGTFFGTSTGRIPGDSVGHVSAVLGSGPLSPFSSDNRPAPNFNGAVVSFWGPGASWWAFWATPCVGFASARPVRDLFCLAGPVRVVEKSGIPQKENLRGFGGCQVRSFRTCGASVDAQGPGPGFRSLCVPG